MLMQLSIDQQMYLRCQSSDVSFEIIAINVITSLTFVPNDDNAVLSTVFDRIIRQSILFNKGSLIQK